MVTIKTFLNDMQTPVGWGRWLPAEETSSFPTIHANSSRQTNQEVRQ
jgi:hypothetical protein